MDNMVYFQVFMYSTCAHFVLRALLAVGASTTSRTLSLLEYRRQRSHGSKLATHAAPIRKQDTTQTTALNRERQHTSYALLLVWWCRFCTCCLICVGLLHHAPAVGSQRDDLRPGSLRQQSWYRAQFVNVSVSRGS